MKGRERCTHEYRGKRGEVDGATGKGKGRGARRPSGGRRDRGGFGENEENCREGRGARKIARRVGNTVGNTRPGDALPRQDRSRKAEPPAMVHCRDRTPEEGVKAVSALLGAFVAVSRASTPAPTRRHALKTALLLGN